MIRNSDPKLAAVPTVIVPPDIVATNNNMPNLGDPKSTLVIPSNGTGSGGGIGSGSDGGVGSGNGRGVGPGSEAALAAAFTAWRKGVTEPRVIYQPEPEYSEEARKAKYQGTLRAEAGGRRERASD